MIQTLESITQSTNTQIILATHSRYMINNIPSSARMFWLERGALKQDIDIDKLKLLNNLGALDHSDEFSKEILIFTEDEKKMNMNT